MKSNNRLVIPADKVWDARKPKYNGFACGHGAHRNKKAYTRKRKHRDLSYDEGSGLLMLIIMVPIMLMLLHGMLN